MDLATVNWWLGLATLKLQVVTVLLIAIYLLRRQEFFRSLTAFIAKWSLLVAFLSTLIASTLTLYYSEFLGIEPCPLCWWQRVFLYSQVVLFGIALWKRHGNVTLYSIALSVFGLGFALYHHALQVMPAGTLPCPATGVSCAARFMFEFGYITYPMMAATLFVFLVILMLFVRRGENS